MGTRSKDSDSRLTRTAATLDAEVVRFEKLVRELEVADIDSEKTLHRAATRLEESAQIQKRLGEALQAFAQAMQEMQERQQQCIDATRLAADRIAQRFAARNALLHRVAALGERARAINEPVAAAMASSADEGEASSKVLSSLDAVLALTASAIEEADALQRAAKEDAFSDIERDTGTLKQQLQSVRNKVLTTQRSVAARSPS